MLQEYTLNSTDFTVLQFFLFSPCAKMEIDYYTFNLPYSLLKIHVQMASLKFWFLYTVLSQLK